MVCRCLSVQEIHWSTIEKELLVIVYAITKLRVYLIGVNFEIVTNHKGRTLIPIVNSISKRSPKTELLQQYSFWVTYCKGTDNIVADFFREIRNHIKSIENPCLALTRIEKHDAIFNDFKKVSELQKVI